MLHVRWIVPIAILSVGGSLEAQQSPRAIAVQVPVAPAIDGRLDDAAWVGAEVLTNFVQREPTEGRPVSERTEVRVVYDEGALYVGAWMFDSDPSSLVVGQTLRDASVNDSDAFLMVIDTYLDHQNGFVFGTTPAGIEYDGQISNEGQGGGGGGARQLSGSGGGFNLNWDGSWQVATSTDQFGWYAEMRIPFSTLRYGEGGQQTWGINFERKIRRKSEQSVWAPIPRQFNLYRVSMAGTLDLQAPTKRVVTVSPYVLGDGFKDYTVAVPDADFGSRFGVDAKVGINQSLVLDLTVNTDFAQVEVDDQQVNLTRFSLFFPEKRAFFLENAGTFSVGTSRSAELFFSRRIGLASEREVPIQVGARITGRVGGLQVGVLNIVTDDFTILDSMGEDSLQIAPANNFGVVRIYRELANRTQIGGILVSRVNTSDTDDYNMTYGLDGQLGIGQALTFQGWVGLTTTPLSAGEPDLRTGFNNGEYGFSGSSNYVTRDWEMAAGYRQIGTDFNPEVGFVNRLEYRTVSASVLRHLRTDDVPWFREFRPHINWSQFWSLGGFSESYRVHIDSHFQFENGAFFQLPGVEFHGEGLEESFEIREGIVIPAGSYSNFNWAFRANTNRSAPLSISVGWSLGGFWSGTRWGPNATVQYRFEDRFTTSLQARYFDVRLDEGSFKTAVLNLNASYSFTPRLYLQANLQYSDDTENFGTNIRLGWLDTAGTGFFIVYNDTEHLGEFERTGIRAGPRQRQLVLKYSRLFELTR